MAGKKQRHRDRRDGFRCSDGKKAATIRLNERLSLLRWEKGNGRLDKSPNFVASTRKKQRYSGKIESVRCLQPRKVTVHRSKTRLPLPARAERQRYPVQNQNLRCFVGKKATSLNAK